MNNYQKVPLKIYIQDIFRAERTDSKYVYKLFDLTFKNVMLHGVVTSLYNTTETATNLELSDATGSVQVYYDTTKSNIPTSGSDLNDLNSQFQELAHFNVKNINIISTVMNRINRKTNIVVTEGSFVSIIGDIFTGDKGTRMISAYLCTVTSVERDLIWLEELNYLYEKFYLWQKE